MSTRLGMYPCSALRALWISGILLLAVISAHSAPSLADALDNSQLIWQTGGDAPWLGQTLLSHDVVDAAQSGVLLDGQESWIQTTVQGPGPLTFWWHVSSELGYDQLQFLIDGVEQVYISGEVDWQVRNFDVPAGAHILKWRYAKDLNESGGADLAWLDQVSYLAPIDSRPEITTHPSSQIVAAGATVSFTVVGTGIPAPTYRWYFNNSLLSGLTNATLTLDSVTTNQSGPYFVVLSNYLGSVTSSPAVLLVTVLGDAFEAPELIWTTGGAASWFAQTAVTHDAVDAAQSGSITNFEESWVQTVVKGPGALTFWWKVSSEAFYDGLQFLTNGNVAASLSGEANWEQKTFLFPPGNQTLRWRYFKDGSITIGEDKGWLDQVAFVPNKPPTALNLSYASPVDEGDLVILNGSFSDPDAPEPHSLEIDWGDGSPVTVSNLPPGVVSFGLSHRFTDDNPTQTSADSYTIRATVSDETGSTSTSVPLVVRNVAPFFQNFTISSPILPQEQITVSGNFGDVGTQDTHSLEIDWGDGSVGETNLYALGVVSFNAKHRYSVGNTNFNLRFTLRDDDGGVTVLSTNAFVMLPARPKIASQHLLAPGRMELHLQGTPNANYQIQASRDLKNWVTIALRTADTNGLFQCVDTDPFRYTARFYRGFWQSQFGGMRLSQVTALPNARVLLAGIGLPGASYQLESSTNLNDWTALTNVVVDASGTLQTEDPSPPLLKRFYRLARPAP